MEKSMSKLECQCEKVYRLRSETDEERMLIIERKFNEAYDLISNIEFDNEGVLDTCYEGEIDVVFCSQCKRIHLLLKNDVGYTTYIIEK